MVRDRRRREVNPSHLAASLVFPAPLPVECKCVFGEESYTSDSVIELTVHLRSSAPLSLNCSSIHVLLDDKARRRRRKGREHRQIPFLTALFSAPFSSGM